MSSQLKDHILEFVRLLNENDYIEVSEMFTEDFCYVRPSGNPLDKAEWLELFDKLSMKGTKLVGINFINVVANMGYVSYTTHTKFIYNEVINEDIAVFVAIFTKVEGKWQISYIQRSTGRKPEEPLPVFKLI